jgi:hypothetical protein
MSNDPRVNDVPSPGARVVHESEFVTEYSDGTEEVRFSEAEWEQMLTDPKFGYVGTCGHSTAGFLSDGSCPICEAAMYYEQEPEANSTLDLVPTAAPISESPLASDPDEIPF